MSGKLLKSTAVVSFMTLISRISGLVRDIIFARYFGVTGGTDAFFVAFRIPNLLRRQFAEGAFSQAFVPVFTEYKTTRELGEVRQLAADVTGTLGFILFLITLLGVIAAPLLVLAFAPGWVDGDNRFALTTEMLRITFPYILFISLTALAGGILNAYGRFAVPAITPVLLNICLIAAAYIAVAYMDASIVVLAWGVFFAGLVQLAFQFPFLLRLRVVAMPRWAWRDSGVQKVKNLMIPALFSNSVQQINLVVDVIIASFLIEGSVTWLYYADRLVEFPLGVFGIAIATVILPSLSARFAKSEPDRFNHTLDWGMRLCLLVGAPATIALVLLAGPLLSTLFQYGKFDSHNAYMSELALIGYSVGLLGFMYVKVLSPGFFARQNTKAPMKIALIAMAVKFAITLILVVGMIQLDYEAPHVGLALATGLSAIFQAWLLYRGLRKDGSFTPLTGWVKFLLQIGVASLLMGLVLYFGVDEFSVWDGWTVFQRAWHLLMWVIIGAGIYFTALLLLGLRPIHFVMHKGVSDE